MNENEFIMNDRNIKFAKENKWHHNLSEKSTLSFETNEKVVQSVIK